MTVKTTAGPEQLSKPKLRGTTEAFASRLSGSHVTKTRALESLVIAPFVRGLSARDVEAAQAWAERQLDGITLDYLFLDASFFRMHPGSRQPRPPYFGWPFVPKPSRAADCQRRGMPVLGRTVRQRPLASTAGDGDCYSLDYSVARESASVLVTPLAALTPALAPPRIANTSPVGIAVGVGSSSLILRPAFAYRQPGGEDHG